MMELAEEQKVPEIKALGEDEEGEEDAEPLSDEELKQARSLHAKILKYRECFPSEMRY